MQLFPDAPDLDELSAFVALADEGSFAGAARRLNRDPTAVSRRVQALETRLGVRLAERTTRRVTLTEAGLAYVDRLRTLLRELDSAHAAASAFAGDEPQGVLRVALPAGFGRTWLSPLLAGFLERYRRVSIEAEYSNRYVDLVGEGFDVAMRAGILPDSRLIASKIGDRKRVACASPDYLARRGTPLGPRGLTGHDCLRLKGKNNPGVWEFTNRSRIRQAIKVSGPLVSDNAGSLIDAAVAGLGIVYCSSLFVGREIEDGRLVPILRDWTARDEGGIYLVTPSRNGVPSKTRAFVDWMIGHAQEKRCEPMWKSDI